MRPGGPSDLDAGAVLEPGAEGTRAIARHGEGVDRGGVEDVDLVAGPGEGDVEHALDVVRSPPAAPRGAPVA